MIRMPRMRMNEIDSPIFTVVEALFLSGVVVILVWLIVKVCKRRTYRELGLQSHGHIWHRTDFIRRPTYCSACIELCLSGRYCSSCNIRICTNESCFQAAKVRSKCKYLLPRNSYDSVTQTPHHWVKGNLPLESVCMVCQETCGDSPGIVDVQCAWCGRCKHDKCVSQDTFCDLGQHRALILPPTSTNLKAVGRGKNKRLILDGLVQPSHIHGWIPLIILANPKSGGQDGERVMEGMMRRLNPLQVINLVEIPPDKALGMCSLLPEVTWYVIVCGGDGTVGWVLSAIDQMRFKNPPSVGIIPLGTGNDLARVLGWGEGYKEDPLSDILNDIEHAQTVMMDRWKVNICNSKRFGVEQPPKRLILNNYFGIGCDAGVALKFHRRRQRHPGLFMSRFFNKAWYLLYGAKDVLKQSCKSLHSKIELWLDDKKVELPALEGIVVLNINSWSAGCTVWNDTAEGTLTQSKLDDGLLEVIGLYSSLHIGAIQVQMDQPLRIGQAQCVKVMLKDTVPVQIDGEPWLQKPSLVTIEHHKQSSMLKKLPHENISRSLSSKSLPDFATD